MFASAVKQSELGDHVGDLVAQETARPGPAAVVHEIVTGQLQKFRSQLSELVQLQQEYVDDGGRSFFCELIQRLPDADAVAATIRTDDPLAFAEALYDMLDHRGRVKPGMMAKFAELCENTAELHQRAVLVAVVENFSTEDFRSFVKSNEVVEPGKLTWGLAIFKTWVVAATQPPVPPKTIYTKREQEWCLQIAAHMLAYLLRWLTQQNGADTSAAFESDKQFWRGLLPDGAPLKNNPLVKLLKGIERNFKKGLYGVGGVGGGKKKTLSEAFPVYGYTQYMDKLKQAATALLSEKQPAVTATSLSSTAQGQVQAPKVPSTAAVVPPKRKLPKEVTPPPGVAPVKKIARDESAGTKAAAPSVGSSSSSPSDVAGANAPASAPRRAEAAEAQASGPADVILPPAQPQVSAAATAQSRTATAAQPTPALTPWSSAPGTSTTVRVLRVRRCRVLLWIRWTATSRTPCFAPLCHRVCISGVMQESGKLLRKARELPSAAAASTIEQRVQKIKWADVASVGFCEALVARGWLRRQVCASAVAHLNVPSGCSCS
jgi:hypothetical protein